MPFKTFGLACIVIALVSPHADAQHVDFAKLLNTIHYDAQEEPAAGSSDAPETAPSETAPSETAAPESAPSEAAAPALIPRLPGAKLSEYGEIRGEPVDRLLADDPLLSDEESREADAPAAIDELDIDQLERGGNTSPAEAVDAPPSDGAARQENVAEDTGTARREDPLGRRVDFSAILGDRAAAGAVAAPGAYHGQLTAAPSAAPCECDKCRDALPVVPCLDHVDLPPPMSLESAYRTPACYRGLWSGYEQQRQQECQRRHKHLPGHTRVPIH